MAEPRCDHKFIDSPHCLKCGWKPEPMTPTPTPANWFAERADPERRGMIEVRWFPTESEAQAQIAAWGAGHYWENPHNVRARMEAVESAAAQPTPAQLARARAVVRGHDKRCDGERFQDRPWCSTESGDSPLCHACQSLATAIARALADEAQQAQVEPCDSCGLTHAGSRWVQGGRSGWEECRLRQEIEQAHRTGRQRGLKDAIRLMEVNSVGEFGSWIVGPAPLIAELRQLAEEEA